MLGSALTGRDDRWGILHFTVGYLDGRSRREMFRDQLVPAYALEPRNDGKPLQ